MKTTAYFDREVRAKRPEIRPEWCAEVIKSPLRRQTQSDGRIRFWGAIIDDGEKRRVLRVVTLNDGETVHNAFFDRRFREDEP